MLVPSKTRIKTFGEGSWLYQHQENPGAGTLQDSDASNARNARTFRNRWSHDLEMLDTLDKLDPHLGLLLFCSLSSFAWPQLHACCCCTFFPPMPQLLLTLLLCPCHLIAMHTLRQLFSLLHRPCHLLAMPAHGHLPHLRRFRHEVWLGGCALGGR